MKMEYPKNKKELQRFLGTINYLGKFIPNLSDETAILRTLLKKESLWSFDNPHMKSVDRLKELVSSSPVLKFFDTRRETRVTTDASKEGLGALLEQKFDDGWHPIAYGSRSLTKSEVNYAPIELETLAVVFACKRFNVYLYGRRFTVKSDHQPLKSIFSSVLANVPPRLQRFLLSVQKYDFEVEYVKGVENVVADAFSRNPLPNEGTEISEEELSSYVHLVVSMLPISSEKFEELVEATKEDTVLQLLKSQIKKGWPLRQKEVDSRIAPFFPHKNELTETSGIILRGSRIVVPSIMRSDMVKLLHKGHMGEVNIKRRAKTAVFWPNINSHLTDIVKNCETCQEYRNKQSNEPLLPHDVPEKPWVKEGTDLFALGGKDYLIVVDYTSKYFDVVKLPNATARCVVEYTKEMFSRYGIPKEVVSDNGPCFHSKKYKKFSKDWDFKHTKSSPKYPRSNGMVERTIQTVKKTIRKCRKRGEDVHEAMLVLRTSPKVDGLSPGERLMQRRLRSTLPMIQEKGEYQPVVTETNHKEGKHKLLPKLSIGDRVRIHEGKSWSRLGRVVNVKDPRSYVVRTDKGTTLRRNRRDVLKVPDDMNLANDYDVIDSEDDDNGMPDHGQQREDDNVNVTIPEVPTSRSGRSLRRPAYLNDYE